jgi:hypothetical protein
MHSSELNIQTGGSRPEGRSRSHPETSALTVDKAIVDATALVTRVGPRGSETQNARLGFVRAQHFTLIYLSHEFAPSSRLKVQG